MVRVAEIAATIQGQRFDDTFISKNFSFNFNCFISDESSFKNKSKVWMIHKHRTHQQCRTDIQAARIEHRLSLKSGTT